MTSPSPRVVREVLVVAEAKLAKAAVENPLLDAEWIVAHVLGKERLKLALSADEQLIASEVELVSQLVDRRASRVPLQYVLGNAFFADLDLKVDSRVLIPRPETEDLLSRIIEMTEANPDRILDLGTGSGALALGLAHAFPESEVIAVDQSPAALALAQENAVRNELSGRVNFLISDWFDQLEGKFDLIVSNPPYLDEDEWLACEPEVRDYEPKQSLVSEFNDSSADLKRIVTSSASRLRPGGALFLETGEGHHTALHELAIAQGYVEQCGMLDLRNRPRFFFARRPV